MNKLALILLFLLFLFVGCAQKSDYRQFKDKVDQQEARSLDEIRHDSREILRHHPEIDNITRSSVERLIADALETHKVLRERESKVIQLMLKKSLGTEATSELTIGDLQKELRQIYDDKGDNIGQLIAEIKKETEKAHPSEEFFNEMSILFREWR